MYSFPNLEPVSCSMSGSNCCFLIHIQVSQEAGKVVWYSQLFKNFQWSMFFWNTLAFSMIQRMLPIWSLVPLPFLNLACTFWSSWLRYCWSLAWRILSVIACERSATVLPYEHSLAAPFFGTEMKAGLLQSCGHWRVFQICWHAQCSTLTASPLRTLNSSAGIL